GGQHRAQTLDQQRVVAKLGIVELCFLCQGDRPFGEAVENQIIELTPLGKLYGRLDPTTGESSATADPDDPGPDINNVSSLSMRVRFAGIQPDIRRAALERLCNHLLEGYGRTLGSDHLGHEYGHAFSRRVHPEKCVSGAVPAHGSRRKQPRARRRLITDRETESELEIEAAAGCT